MLNAANLHGKINISNAAKNCLYKKTDKKHQNTTPKPYKKYKQEQSLNFEKKTSHQILEHKK